MPGPINTIMNGNILFLGTEADEKYTAFLKPHCSAAPSTFVILKDVQYLQQVQDYCKRKNIDKVITTNAHFLYKLVEKDWPAGMRKKPSIEDYAGSVFTLGDGIADVLIINPLKQCFTKTYGKFMLARFISKLTKKEDWYEPTPFTFSIAQTSEELASAFNDLQSAFAISVDIETVKQHGAIACAGYCGVFKDARGNISTRTYVIPVTSHFALTYIRKINSLPIEKVFQNGKYDNFYFLRWNAPVTNWLWDTAHLFHSYYSELPKSLGFLNAFFLRKVQYWKDLAQVGDKYLYYKYNALDCWATMNVWLIQMKEMPDWAARNYTLEFPVVFPCLLSEMTGVRRDPVRMAKAITERTAELNSYQTSLNRILGVAYFNTNSPTQMEALFKVLGLATFAETTKKNADGEYIEAESYADKILEKAKLAHPFGGRIIGIVQKIREIRKEISTYLQQDVYESKTDKYGITTTKQVKEASEFKRTVVGAASESGLVEDGRILYSLNPHYTTTGRLASGESALWCGFNIQNGPREGPYKSTIGAEPGFYIAECDLKQAESRDTANISGDAQLLAALDSENDFHALNASAFFGVPYDQIFDNRTLKTINKKLRDLSKRTNHGANYNMGPAIMLDTMGEEKVAEAKVLLKLPIHWSLIKVCEYLLERFHATYPSISKVFYPFVVRSVIESRMLRSRVVHHVERTSGKLEAELALGDWTRYCFGNPDKSKRDLNSYVAHVPQSLNARTLNEAYVRVFYDLALGNRDFRLYAQIHDSILFGFRRGTHESYCEGVRSRMQIPVTIDSCDGKRRTFTVPADIKAGKSGVGAEYWSETE